MSAFILKLVPMAVVAAAVAVGLSIQAADGQRQPHAIATTVSLFPGSITYPMPGEFLKNGRPQTNPKVEQQLNGPLEIMTYQVSAADYTDCVSAGACRPAEETRSIPHDAPATTVSYLDAVAYARWYSEATGDQWRLPTDEEWAFAAAERFAGEFEGVENDANNPARRWLTSYQAELDLNRKPDPLPRSRGSFGVNSRGLADFSGNVWEWTSTCYVRTTLAEDGSGVVSAVDNCGVHVLEGLHRAYMSNFVSDGKSGGCAVGLPPDNLGFRLVRGHRGWANRFLSYLGIT
ncbi:MULTISPECIES: SUMF1/EgtB/PvdO family nonheme iron enzyme [unclassified Mesorhizobium]|uniref:SUMF1/EgtB/PvdO family nonheme iron enzyme n=1 Tax=unclassified Mesorhizobium TaxID=325217 RepID=UPI0011277410|nr:MULTISPECIES: SUMF1/EgtB/PvdO family nonheme iron enzyme [unclassified Mesorhizobium]TPJ40970.1 formylglycine-generating enzyme family protein [Mesorhizobium sp. B2-6-6]MCA0008679.1 formylglycine-generating enzyme family protein [Mesorhizobium sp. B264B1B]MCA0019443.1 formylglycine-generating enzyme family protein [Mesorhizobium sp. B264B1A]MCA0024516.1 formylglycine-generating enzyme family protein [Mesorhizobium sp. B263B1A]MCA0055812.1 formylglycine-generating enzyme family protein [Meso